MKDLLEHRIAKLEKEIKQLKGEAKARKIWVKASKIIELTGWDKEGMRQARINGYVEFKKEDGHFFYLLDSLHPSFIKQRA